jgi:ATP synthase protein I
MTTEVPSDAGRRVRSAGASSDPVVGPLRLSALCGAVVVVLAVVLAALLGGSTAALSAAVGGGALLVLIGLGALAVHVAASRVPGASMAVALLVITTECFVLLFAFVAISESSLADELSRGWLAGTVAAAALARMAGHAWGYRRMRLRGVAGAGVERRQPAPSPGSSTGSGTTDAGAR